MRARRRRRPRRIAQIVRERGREVARELQRTGPRGLLTRGCSGLTRRLALSSAQLPVRAEDVLAAQAVRPAGPGARATGRPLTVSWVMAPPSAGSGGHTTIFRLVEYLEAQGHRCRLSMYDVHGGDVHRHERVVRENWPRVLADVSDAFTALPPADAVFATSWPTAYRISRSDVSARRFYLVQDWEPLFYPTSSASVLAEATYDLHLHGVAVGPWLAQRLREHGMSSDHVDFGCDTQHYALHRRGPRQDVVFYARPSAPRRAFEVGVLALSLFAREHPESRVHLFGERAGRLPFRYEGHGRLTVPELNELYNRCGAGLSLSLTNVSLTPLEKLAAGCIPVVNDAPHNRAVLRNPYVRWAALTPSALAAALSDVVRDPDQQRLAKEAASSVQGITWSAAGAQLEQILLRELSR